MMPALALRLALSLMQVQAAAALPLDLRIDACVDVDRDELLQLLAVELAGASEHGSSQGARGQSPSIEVTCTGQPEIVRITARRGARVSVRELDLRAAGQAARRARARELSLLIAESVKTREEPAPPRLRSRLVAPGSASKAKPQPWLELAVVGGAEKYSGGYAQLGPTGSARLLQLAPLLIEARVGGRWAPALQAPAGEVSTRAWLVALGAGVDVLPHERAAGLALLARFECDWLFAAGTSRLPESQGLSDDGRAYVLSLASSAWLRLAEGLRVVAEPALVLPLRGLQFQDRDRTAFGLSGLGAAASVGLALRL